MRQRVDQLKGELSRFVALRISGQCQAAESKATDLISAVKATGYLPLLADTLNAAGILGNDCGDPALAAERLKEAYAVATASHHDQAAAEAASVIPGFACLAKDQIPIAHEWLRIARSALQRLGPNMRIEAWILDGECTVLGAEGDNEGALRAARQAFETVNLTLGPEHPDTLIAEQNLGDSLAVAGRFDEGIEATRSALGKVERVLGRDHPMVGTLSYNEGEALERVHRYPEALVAFQRALEIWRRAGSDSFFVSSGLTGLGKALLGEGRPGEAIAPLQEALAAEARKALPRTAVADTKFALARALWSDHEQHARALAFAREARQGFADAADPKTTAEIESWIAHVAPPKTHARNPRPGEHGRASMNRPCSDCRTTHAARAATWRSR
jgi:tetratricopeptide (TPR) repeat protein